MYRIRPFRFLGWWIATALFAIPVSLVALGAVLFPLGMLYSMFRPSFYSEFYALYNGIGLFAAYPIGGAIIGLVIGNLQRWLLRNKLFWAADGWRTWSGIGGFIAGIILYVLPIMMPSYGVSGYALPTMFALGLGAIAAAQLFALRHAVSHAWLWLLANFASVIAFVGVLSNNQIAYYDPLYEWKSLGVIVLAVLSLGLVTGFVILYLFERHILPMKPDGIETAPEEHRPKSVWDDAI